MTNPKPPELTFEEFCAQPLTYTFGINGAAGAHRQYRNNELGVQRDVHTQRQHYDDIYSGWRPQTVSYFLDGDPREFANAAELYEAYMARACGVKEQP